jgi:hypothetical protein
LSRFVKAYLATLGLSVLSLCVVHTWIQQHNTILKFNNLNVNVNVLVANYKTSAFKLNLYICCAIAILISIANNVNTLLQAIS